MPVLFRRIRSLCLAGVTWQRMQGMDAKALFFEGKIATLKKQSVKCINQLEIKSILPSKMLSQTVFITHSKLFGGSLLSVINQNRALLPHIRRHFENGFSSDIASNCSWRLFFSRSWLV